MQVIYDEKKDKEELLEKTMSGKRCGVMNREMFVKVLIFILLLLISSSSAATNFADVAAINSLYAALGSPSIPGWLASAGDPCGESWQGVQCNETDILSITLVSENLGGELGNALGTFSSITKIDFSNNNIGGSIPANLPVTLLNLDLSHNNFSGELPSSMENLSSLTTLHLQNNQLSGTLDVLQDLPLIDLNVENNLFNGQIPDKMLGIPNFKKDGNQFNATVASSPPSGSPTTPPPLPASTRPPFSGLTPGRPSSGSTPAKPATRAPPPEKAVSETTKKNSKTKRVVWISILSVFLAIILLLALLLFIPRCHRRRRESDRIAKQHEVAPYVGSRDNPMHSATLVSRPNSQSEKENPKMVIARPKEEHPKEPRKIGWTPILRNEPERDVQKLSALPKRDDHKIDLSRFDIDSLMPPPPPPPPPPPVEKLFVNPVISPSKTVERHSTNASLSSTPVKSFTIAALQQYTNSFSQENLIGAGMLGTVYRAELPNGKLLAVKKLDKRVSSQQKDDEFIGLVNGIDKIRHANVVELMGYCAEHGQRLLVYEYCSNGTLQDALHSDDDFKKKLSWNARIRMALGAARALEYLHEICEPPIIHRNFKSANVLLDDELAVLISDCGLSTLITSGSVSQLSGHLLTAYGYGAPEFESGIYTSKSDVFSFGVVMLELLTGRKSYDRSRNRGEHFLVRWAIQQLHDIEALSSMVDPSLNGEYPIKALSRFADVISRCVQGEPEFRPPMSEVVQDLLQIIRRESPPRTGED